MLVLSAMYTVSVYTACACKLNSAVCQFRTLPDELVHDQPALVYQWLDPFSPASSHCDSNPREREREREERERTGERSWRDREKGGGGGELGRQRKGGIVGRDGETEGRGGGGGGGEKGGSWGEIGRVNSDVECVTIVLSP